MRKLADELANNFFDLSKLSVREAAEVLSLVFINSVGKLPPEQRVEILKYIQKYGDPLDNFGAEIYSVTNAIHALTEDPLAFHSLDPTDMGQEAELPTLEDMVEDGERIYEAFRQIPLKTFDPQLASQIQQLYEKLQKAKEKLVREKSR